MDENDANDLFARRALVSDVVYDRRRIDDNHVARDIKAIDKLDSTISSLHTEVKNGFDKHLWVVLPFLSSHITYCQVALYVSRQIDSMNLAEREETGSRSSFPEDALIAVEKCREEFWYEIAREPAVHAAKPVLKLIEESETLLDHLSRSMRDIAPNLVEIIGTKTAARFIAKARMMFFIF
ncbi:hypothetical protein F5Y09DRAFT_339376 [Xylaria sp. FL1042]|nr:hypothetical protein F5Y09DRAFT_339376 [Xylaria sp. FL1042]